MSYLLCLHLWILRIHRFSMHKVSRRSERELRAAAQSRASAASKRSSGTSHASKRSSLSRSKGLGLSHLMAGSFEERKCYVANYIEMLAVAL